MGVFNKEAKFLTFIVFAPLIIGLLGVIMIASCSKNQDVPESSTDITHVIFAEEDAERMIPSGGPFGISPPYWTPTEQEILEAEEKLPQYITENMPERSEPITDLNEYKRQYVGITKNGERKIFINAICKAHWSQRNDWRSEILFVLGGGNCFFHAMYDPEMQELSNFSVNAPK